MGRAFPFVVVEPWFPFACEWEGLTLGFIGFENRPMTTMEELM